MSQSKVEIVQDMYAALAAGELDRMKGYLHPDVFVTEADCLPYSGIWRGPDGYLELVNTVVGTFDDLDVTVNAMTEVDNMVICVSEFRGKNKAGVAFEMPLIEVFYFRGEKICEVRPYYFDTHKLAELCAQE